MYSVPKVYEWKGGGGRHVTYKSLFISFLPPTRPQAIPPPLLPLVHFVKTIRHRQTNSSIVKKKSGRREGQASV